MRNIYRLEVTKNSYPKKEERTTLNFSTRFEYIYYCNIKKSNLLNQFGMYYEI